MAKKDDERDYYFKSGPTDHYDGTDSGADSTFLSREDYDAVQGYKSQWAEGQRSGDQALMDAAHQAAEAVRAKYDYSGGANGGAYNVLGGRKRAETAGGGAASGFSYEDAPSYTSRYQDQIDALAQGILGRGSFSYDAEKDPLYQQYRESYTREGERAMQDTLGQVSARTGGLASSYAGSAAQQSYNNYMGALNDKIPELQQLAYSMYMDEGSWQRDNLNMLLGLDQGDYRRYQDSLGQYNTDRGFNYGVYADDWGRDYQTGRDQVNDRRYDSEWSHQLGREDIADQRYQDETSYQKEQDALSWAYQKDADAFGRAMEKWRTTGVLDEESAKVLGLPAGTKTTDHQYQLAQMAARQPSGGSKGSGGGSGSSGSGGGEGGPDYEGLYAAARQSGNPDNFIASNYKKYGMTTATGLSQGYKDWLEADQTGGGGGMNDVNFKGLKQTIYTYIHSGDASGALNVAERNWDVLTEAQREALSAYFSGLGYTLGSA